MFIIVEIIIVGAIGYYAARYDWVPLACLATAVMPLAIIMTSSTQIASKISGTGELLTMYAIAYAIHLTVASGAYCSRQLMSGGRAGQQHEEKSGG